MSKLKQTKTLKIRIRPTSGVVKTLDSYVASVAYIWNYLVERVEDDHKTVGVLYDYSYLSKTKKGKPVTFYVYKSQEMTKELSNCRSFTSVRGVSQNYHSVPLMSQYDRLSLLRNSSDYKSTRVLGIDGTGIIERVNEEFSLRLAKKLELYSKTNSRQPKTYIDRKTGKTVTKSAPRMTASDLNLRKKEFTLNDLKKSRISKEEAKYLDLEKYLFMPNYNNEKGREVSIKALSAKSTGWVPFKGNDIAIIDGKHIKFGGKKGKEMVLMEDIHKLAVKLGSDEYKFGAGSFSRDPLGRWFLNISLTYTLDKARENTGKRIGIDSGFSTTLTTSDGGKYNVPLEGLKDIDKKVAAIQKTVSNRAKLNKNNVFKKKPTSKDLRMSRVGSKKDRRIAKLYIKANNIKKHFIHDAANHLIEKNDVIAFGKLGLKGIQKTMGKSVKYHSIGEIKDKLMYKAASFAENAPVVEMTSERGTTVTCYDCGGDTGPRGKQNLDVRSWDCKSCGSKDIHRDINAAKNILFNFDNKDGSMKRSKKIKVEEE